MVHLSSVYYGLSLFICVWCGGILLALSVMATPGVVEHSKGLSLPQTHSMKISLQKWLWETIDTSETQDSVDLMYFSQQWSARLVYEPVETAHLVFSNRVSKAFQETFRLVTNISTQQSLSAGSLLDRPMFQQQLRDAVAVYTEERIVVLWNQRVSVVNEDSLQALIQHSVLHWCPRHDSFALLADTSSRKIKVSSVCLQGHALQLLYVVQQSIEQLIQQGIMEIVHRDLPPLYNDTQLRVKEAMDQFTRDAMPRTDKVEEWTLMTQDIHSMDNSWLYQSKEIKSMLGDSVSSTWRYWA
ncbi:hypothetical protein BDF14DRAFT_662635 [Spinellus fusiger]|nr:hypothetical protein BDF14DRAFT_662635 [Spinellus fusiger]